jgi:hypothetical protein
MTQTNGTADLLGRKMTLEERIEDHLTRAPTDKDLCDDYVDPSDRERVRRRALIAATLDAIFEHGCSQVEADGLEVEVGLERDVWSDLAAVRCDFKHDIELLNNGQRAQGSLAQMSKESIIPQSTIGAARELLIVWLAVIELWEKATDHNHFKTRGAVRDAAAAASGATPKSYKTSCSNMKNGNRFSQREQEFYHDLLELAFLAAQTPGEKHSAFKILFTAALALSAERMPNKLSADKLKG